MRIRWNNGEVEEIDENEFRSAYDKAYEEWHSASENNRQVRNIIKETLEKLGYDTFIPPRKAWEEKEIKELMEEEKELSQIEEDKWSAWVKYKFARRV